jgi:hypothetical protein
METTVLQAPVDPADLEMVVHLCAHLQAGGRVLSTAQAVEELRIRTGDFLNSDKDLADLISAAALARGCVVVLDEADSAGVTL